VAVRVVLADDAVLFREGLARVLEAADFTVTGQADDAEGLLDVVRADPPDVAITDIRMPPTHSKEGLAAALQIRSDHPDVGVLVLSQYVEASHAVELLSGGAGVGYLLKDRVTDIDEFCAAVRRVASGGTAIDPQVVAELVSNRSHRDPLAVLTDRERDVLALMAQGRSNQSVAAELFVTPKTVETHIANLFAKLGLLPAAEDHRRVLAVLTYLEAR
jgi:DNA-binding NarL/FixJ family response regulator